MLADRFALELDISLRRVKGNDPFDLIDATESLLFDVRAFL